MRTTKFILLELQTVVPWEHDLYDELNVVIQCTPEGIYPKCSWWEDVESILSRYTYLPWIIRMAERQDRNEWQFELGRTWVRLGGFQRLSSPIQKFDWVKDGF